MRTAAVLGEIVPRVVTTFGKGWPGKRRRPESGPANPMRRICHVKLSNQTDHTPTYRYTRDNRAGGTSHKSNVNVSERRGGFSGCRADSEFGEYVSPG